MRRLLLLVSALVLVDTMLYAALTPLLPHYAERFGLSKQGAGALVAAYAIGALVGVLVLMIANIIASFITPGGLGLRDGGGLAIVFSLVVIGVAAFSLPWLSLGGFTAVAIVAGIIAAIAPARRASRLNVLNALQYE